ncbi:MAG: helix-turn-helix domain-containing protein [Deltaproteobacteria bacterium]
MPGSQLGRVVALTVPSAPICGRGAYWSTWRLELRIRTPVRCTIQRRRCAFMRCTIRRASRCTRFAGALRRLSEGEANLSALALELGFASHSHFSDAFRQAFGLSPAQSRAAATADGQREMSKILEVPALAQT